MTDVTTNSEGLTIRSDYVQFEMYKTCKHYKIIKESHSSRERDTFCIRCLRKLKHNSMKNKYIYDGSNTVYDITVPHLLHEKVKVLRNVRTS